MKSSELQKLILSNGWRIVRQTGSHVIYEKPVSDTLFHFMEAKKSGSGLAKKIKREIGLK